jgi:hypothetical protein
MSMYLELDGKFVDNDYLSIDLVPSIIMNKSLRIFSTNL